jgi:hypothetical protein
VDPQTDHPTDRHVRMLMRLAAQFHGRHNRRTMPVGRAYRPAHRRNLEALSL